MKTLVVLRVRSAEEEEGLPKQEQRLCINIELPLQPSPGLLIEDLSTFQNAIIETVATCGQQVIAYLHDVRVGESRVNQIAADYTLNGWKTHG